jgi:colanic acid biosynthesis glycosyl transferase WcaI
MKILIYGINFAPEPIGVGRYTGEMAEMLSSEGHEVRVVTALPYYPEWKVSPGYSKWVYVAESWSGIKVWRAPLWVPFFPGGRKRMLHLLSFAVTSIPLLVRNLFWRPDMVWMAAPSLMCAPAALATARLCGAKSWLHVQDFEVDIAFGMGIISGGFSQRVAFGCERWLLRRFSRISTISKGMVYRALAKGVDKDKVLLVPNWADVRSIVPLRTQSPYRAELNIPANATVALYSGSMGVKQGVDWLAEIAARLAAEPGLYFVFCGDGPLREAAHATCGHLPNVRFLPLQPAERLSDLLGMADIHLLPQRADAGDLVMPSKLTGMLASGRPVAAMAEPGSELSDVVGTCGVDSAPGDLDAFAEGIRHLAAQPALRAELGRNAREFANDHLSSHAVLARLEAQMRALNGSAVQLAEVDAEEAEVLNP